MRTIKERGVEEADELPQAEQIERPIKEACDIAQADEFADIRVCHHRLAEEPASRASVPGGGECVGIPLWCSGATAASSSRHHWLLPRKSLREASVGQPEHDVLLLHVTPGKTQGNVFLPWVIDTGRMRFNERERNAIARGELTQAYRHRKRPQAKAGARHRLGPAGMIEILDVAGADPEGVTAHDAKKSGFASRAELILDIEKYGKQYPGNTLYCVRFRFVDEQDPRSVLAGDEALSDADIATKLDRMDARSPHGPWTRETLRLISEHRGRRAGDLADMLGRERLDFKRDVRKLKELGLTISLEIGYRLSPRGEAFLSA